MAKKKTSSGGSAASFILCSLLSIACGIGACVLMFCKWLDVHFSVSFLSFEQSYSLLQTHQALAEIQNYFQSFTDSVNGILSSVGVQPMNDISIPQIALVEQVTLGLIAAVFVVIAFQVVYVILTLAGNPFCRPIGILAGILTMLLPLASIGMLCYGNMQLNELFAGWNHALEQLQNGFLPLDTLQIDAAKVFRWTIFPWITEALGLFESILAR